jgi:hypothetical protein
MQGEHLTAAAVKEAFSGIIKEKKADHTLLWVVGQHNTIDAAGAEKKAA